MVIIVVLVAGAMIVTRLVYRRFFSVSRRFDSSDWTILAATVVCLPSIAVNVSMARHGLGKDVWGLSPYDLTTFGLYFYIIQILYPILIGLIKISLTLFYLTLFPDRKIRLLLWATVCFHVMFTVSCALIIIFQCLPVGYRKATYVMQEGRLANGHCMNINAAGWANAAITVASDVWLLAIPLSQIRKLTLHWKKKVGAMIMFLTGGGVTIVSILRLQSIRYYANTTNPARDQFDLVWYSTIEVGVGLMCACLPAMRLVLGHVAPRMVGRSLASSSEQMQSTQQSGSSINRRAPSVTADAKGAKNSEYSKPLPRIPRGEVFGAH
ncbi:hypothetical protein NLG97_g5187 [Lecanicillium saksenae]|uniref:Uncharacterized protein n=1 Tax=Lecanicillium saksenae TaxID=468837 RepID=A0ACC1QVQ5_9HYPO|nr:hypothetical protein NLG97_g5187 [Lecanicillium saksenae]